MSVINWSSEFHDKSFSKIWQFCTKSYFCAKHRCLILFQNLKNLHRIVPATNWSNEFHDKYFFLFKISSFYYFIFLISEPSQLIDLQNMVVWENICSFFRPAPASSFANKIKIKLFDLYSIIIWYCKSSKISIMMILH